MAENKKSFLLYTDVHFTVQKLTDEQAGKLFKHILSYVNDENPVMNDFVLELVFEPIKQSLKRDLRKYEDICFKRSQSGREGGVRSGEIRRKKKEANEANALNRSKTKQTKQKQANEADNDNDNDNDNKNIYNFWESYHSITGLKKTDFRAAEKYWDKLTYDEREKAIENIKPYFDSLSDPKFCKKARTYLADKNFDDEFEKPRMAINRKEKPYLPDDLIPNPDWVEPIRLSNAER